MKRILIKEIKGMAKYAPWVKKALALVNKDCKVIADIGAGCGWLHPFLFEKFPNLKTLYAVEPNNIGRDKITLATPINGCFTDFKVPEKVDLILFSASFHHCSPEDLPYLFANIKNISKPDTGILFVTEFYINWGWIIRRIISCLRMGNLDVFAPAGGNYFRTKRQIINIFKNYGFDIKLHRERLKITSLTTGPQSLLNNWRYYYAYVGNKGNKGDTSL